MRVLNSFRIRSFNLVQFQGGTSRGFAGLFMMTTIPESAVVFRAQTRITLLQKGFGLLGWWERKRESGSLFRMPDWRKRFLIIRSHEFHGLYPWVSMLSFFDFRARTYCQPRIPSAGTNPIGITYNPYPFSVGSKVLAHPMPH